MFYFFKNYLENVNRKYSKDTSETYMDVATIDPDINFRLSN